MSLDLYTKMQLVISCQQKFFSDLMNNPESDFFLQPRKRLSPGALEQLKKGFADLLTPVSRVIRVDVVRYILSQEKQKRELLSRYA